MSDSVASGVSTSPFDYNLMNELSFRLNTGLSDYYKDINLESSFILKSEKPADQNLLNIIIEYINKAIEKGISVLNDLLTAIFDKIIEILIKNSKINKKDPFISFRNLYVLFHSFGMREVSLKTLNFLTSALQYKICTTNWVGDEEFWLNYFEELPKQSIKESKTLLDRFIRTHKTMKYEEERIKQFNLELSEFVNLE